MYWKNYAERIEELTKDFEEARKIYERSVVPLRYSEASWYNYTSFCGDRALKALESLSNSQSPATAQANGNKLNASTLSTIARETFEKAIDAVGIDFSAQEIWSKYIDFEVASCDFKKVITLFDRALSIPMNNLENVWNKYRIYAQGRPIEDVLTAEELSAHKAKLAGIFGDGSTEVAKRLEVESINSAIDKHELTYKRTLAEVEKRAAYEKIALNRSYFHVMPMSADGIANWKAYLRWEEQQEKSSSTVDSSVMVSPGKRTVQLYERCLIPCCACQEFWFMYVDYLQRHGDEEAVKNVFERATKVYFKYKPSFFLKYALFEEANSRAYKADDIYSALLARAPGHIEATLAYAAFLRRRGDEAKCRDLLEKAIASVPQGRSRQKALLMIHLAKFFEQTEKNTLARSTYSELTHTCKGVLEGWLCAIDFEVNEIKLCASDDEKSKIESRINTLFHNALIDSCRLSMVDKRKLWVSWSEVSADCEFSIKTISAVEADYSVVLSGSFPDWTHSDTETPPDSNSQENGSSDGGSAEEELLPPGKKQKIITDGN